MNIWTVCRICQCKIEKHLFKVIITVTVDNCGLSLALGFLFCCSCFWCCLSGSHFLGRRFLSRSLLCFCSSSIACFVITCCLLFLSWGLWGILLQFFFKNSEGPFIKVDLCVYWQLGNGYYRAGELWPRDLVSAMTSSSRSNNVRVRVTDLPCSIGCELGGTVLYLLLQL